MNKTIVTLAALAACGLAAGSAVADGMVGMEEETAEATPETPAPTAGAQTNTAAPSSFARLSAGLVDEQGQAQKRQATVKVKVTGLRLVDPLTAGERPRADEGHISYKLDDGPLIETTATTLSFSQLDSGTHDITVMLSGNDHAPLGPSETLQVTIP